MSSFWHEFIPKSYTYLTKGYSFETFRKDLVAGITVGIIALPLAMAFAIASGVEPARGLYTAIIAGFLISLLGGSRIQIGGPTGAFVVIIYDIMQRTGYEGLCVSSLIAAFILIFLGILRIGSWVQYIPSPLIAGFTSGLAVVIFSTQIKDFLGLQMGALPAHFIPKCIAYSQSIDTVHLATVSVALGTLLFILFLRRFFSYIPWGVGAIAAATFLCYLLDLPVPTIESRFGMIPRTLPSPSLPYFAIPADQIREVLVDAFSIAFLGGIESLLSAVVGDQIIRAKHRSNCELVAQGIANFSSILFGGIPATGAIARTAANAKTGAKTPVAGMIHAITLFFLIYCLAPIASLIPLPALAAVLMVIAWNMLELHYFEKFFKIPVGDRLILLSSFLLTIFVDITAAVGWSMIFAFFHFVQQMAKSARLQKLSDLWKGSLRLEHSSHPSIPAGVKVFELHGPVFFGTAHILHSLLETTAPKPHTCILRLKETLFIDASGMHAFKEFFKECKRHNIEVKLSEIKSPMKQQMEAYGLLKNLGSAHCFSSFDEALAWYKKT